MDQPLPTLPNRLQSFRDRNGFTRADLANALGVKEITVYRWERGAARPSPLAATKLSEIGFGELRPEETNASSRPRLQKKGIQRATGHVDMLRESSTLQVRVGTQVRSAVPTSWMRNGPSNQEDFHKRLVAMQSEGLAAFSEKTASRRMSLIESVTGVGETAQFQLEKPKPTAVSWNSNYGPHGWHRYVGRFPPHVVRSLLNYFGAGHSDLILDPFLGSGTTALECRLLGIPSIGIEICPLSAMISRVKAKFPSDPGVMQAIAGRFATQFEQLSRTLTKQGLGHDHATTLARTGNLMPEFTNVERWFTPEALVGTSAAVEIAMSEPSYAREAMLVALSAKMRSIGNVDVDVVRAEYSKKPRENVNVGRLMARQLKKMVDDTRASLRTHSDLIGQPDSIDVREGSVLGTQLGSRSVSHIITSPPYGVEAISYLRTHLLSYRSLVAHLKHDPYDTRDQTIGSEYMDVRSATEPVQVRRASPTFRDFFRVPENDPKLESRRLAMMDFFEDMYEVGARFADWLVDGGRVAFIIGNKRLGERVIPTDQIIAEIFGSVGMRHTESIHHKLKTNNSNSQVPWQERVIQDEAIMLFQREAR